MTPGADRGVSTRSAPTPRAEKVSPAPGSPPGLRAAVAGMPPGAGEARDRRGGGGFGANLPRGSGLDLRARLPAGWGEAGAGPRRGRGGSGGGAAVLTTGAHQRSAVCGGGAGLGGAEQVSRDVLGVLGRPPARQAQLWAGKLLCLSFQMGKSPGGWRSLPGEARLPAGAGGGELQGQPRAEAAARAGQRCGLLASSLSQAGRVQTFQGSRSASFTPVGTRGGLRGVAGQAWGHARQCSALLTAQ